MPSRAHLILIKNQTEPLPDFPAKVDQPELKALYTKLLLVEAFLKENNVSVALLDENLNEVKRKAFIEALALKQKLSLEITELQITATEFLLTNLRKELGSL